jgi:hypothetical protein
MLLMRVTGARQEKSDMQSNSSKELKVELHLGMHTYRTKGTIQEIGLHINSEII